MDIFDKYPEVKKRFEVQCQTRRNEILTHMLETDNGYKELCRERSNASMTLKNSLIGQEANVLFEKYSDAVYAQEVYELGAIYKQAFMDALIILQDQCLL